MNCKLAAAIVTVASLTGCWNGTPFQVDFSGKAKVDYPEGDPRRAGSGTPTASGSQTPEKDNSLKSAFPAYDIPEGDVTVGHAVVLQPRGTYPARLDMFRMLDKTFTTVPETIKVRVQVAVTRFPASAYSNGAPSVGCTPEGVFRIGDRPVGIDYDTFDAKTRDVELDALSFDGTFDKTYHITTNAAFDFDGMPIYKPMALKATVAGILTGYSKPFILGPSERNLDGQYIPVEMDVQLIPQS